MFVVHLYLPELIPKHLWRVGGVHSPILCIFPLSLMELRRGGWELERCGLIPLASQGKGKPLQSATPSH